MSLLYSVLEHILGGDPLGSDFGDMSRVTVRRERSSISWAMKSIVFSQSASIPALTLIWSSYTGKRHSRDRRNGTQSTGNMCRNFDRNGCQPINGGTVKCAGFHIRGDRIRCSNILGSEMIATKWFWVKKVKRLRTLRCLLTKNKLSGKLQQEPLESYSSASEHGIDGSILRQWLLCFLVQPSKHCT